MRIYTHILNIQINTSFTIYMSHYFYIFYISDPMSIIISVGIFVVILIGVIIGYFKMNKTKVQNSSSVIGNYII